MTRGDALQMSGILGEMPDKYKEQGFNWWASRELENLLGYEPQGIDLVSSVPWAQWEAFLNQEIDDSYSLCKKRVLAILQEHIDKSRMINFSSDSEGVPIIMQLTLHNCYMQLLSEMEEKL